MVENVSNFFDSNMLLDLNLYGTAILSYDLLGLILEVYQPLRALRTGLSL